MGGTATSISAALSPQRCWAMPPRSSSCQVTARTFPQAGGRRVRRTGAKLDRSRCSARLGMTVPSLSWTARRPDFVVPKNSGEQVAGFAAAPSASPRARPTNSICEPGFEPVDFGSHRWPSTPRRRCMPPSTPAAAFARNGDCRRTTSGLDDPLRTSGAVLHVRRGPMTGGSVVRWTLRCVEAEEREQREHQDASTCFDQPLDPTSRILLGVDRRKRQGARAARRLGLQYHQAGRDIYGERFDDAMSCTRSPLKFARCRARCLRSGDRCIGSAVR